MGGKLLPMAQKTCSIFFVVCESKKRRIKFKRVAVATERGEYECSVACVDKARILVTNLNQMYTGVLRKMNRKILKTGQDDQLIIVKFVPYVQSRCVKRKKKTLMCDCPTTVQMYGSKSAQAVLDDALRQLTKQPTSSNITTDESRVTAVYDIEALERELHEFDDNDNGQHVLGKRSFNNNWSPQTVNEQHHAITVVDWAHILQRRAHGGHYSHPKPHRHYGRRLVGAVWGIAKFALVAALLAVTVVVIFIPPLWIFLPIIIILWIIIR